MKTVIFFVLTAILGSSPVYAAQNSISAQPIPVLWWIAPIGSLLALMFAFIFYKGMMKKSEGNDTMKQIAGYVRKGAMAYLKQQYKVVALFFLFAFIFLAFLAYVLKVQNKWVPFAFLTGGFFSSVTYKVYF